MKQKVLLMSLFLVFSIFLSSLVAITSLSLTNQIKSTFGKEENEEFEGFAMPFSGEMTLLKDKVGVEDGIPILMFFKDKFTPFESSSPGNKNKTTVFSFPLIILLFLITYFFIKHYKKKRKKRINNHYEIEEAQKVVLKNKVEYDITPSTMEKKVTTTIQLNETRRLLQRWEARLSRGGKKKEAETINEWFERINGPIEIIPIYERVRYGEKSCTEDEFIFLKNTLKL